MGPNATIFDLSNFSFEFSLSLSLSLSPDASANMLMFRSNRINLLSVRAFVFVVIARTGC